MCNEDFKIYDPNRLWVYEDSYVSDTIHIFMYAMQAPSYLGKVILVLIVSMWFKMGSTQITT